MSDTNYVTEETFERLKTELQHMKGVDRPAASKAIAEAREKGDLKENAEIKSATMTDGILTIIVHDVIPEKARAKVVDIS